MQRNLQALQNFLQCLQIFKKSRWKKAEGIGEKESCLFHMERQLCVFATMVVYLKISTAKLMSNELTDSQVLMERTLLPLLVLSPLRTLLGST